MSTLICCFAPEIINNFRHIVNNCSREVLPTEERVIEIVRAVLAGGSIELPREDFQALRALYGRILHMEIPADRVVWAIHYAPVISPPPAYTKLDPELITDFMNEAYRYQNEAHATYPQLSPNRRRLFLVAIQLYRKPNNAQLLADWETYGGHEELNRIKRIITGVEVDDIYSDFSFFRKYPTIAALQEALRSP